MYVILIVTNATQNTVNRHLKFETPNRDTLIDTWKNKRTKSTAKTKLNLDYKEVLRQEKSMHALKIYTCSKTLTHLVNRKEGKWHRLVGSQLASLLW